MLQRLTLSGIELPRLYIAQNNDDVKLAKKNGVPYIRWASSKEDLIKLLLRPTLERMFPHIKWNSVLGPRSKFKTNVCITKMVPIEEPEPAKEAASLATTAQEVGSTWEPDDSDKVIGSSGKPTTDNDGCIVEDATIADGERIFDTPEQRTMMRESKLDIKTYVGDLSSCVNLDVLQSLKLMPAFIGDILECVKLNIGSGLYWREGYNKKLGLAVGNYNASPVLPNLIILDVSGSIPRGISATMIGLIDTLRSQLSADLIITSTNSRFYPMGSELPDPQTIRDQFGYGNETFDFLNILNKHIKGRHYGHVFSFGDDDTPAYYLEAVVGRDGKQHKLNLEGTRVDCVHHYHTGKYNYSNGKTGYAKWCHMLLTQPQDEYDTSWCKVIKD